MATLGLLVQTVLANIYHNNSVWNVSYGDQIAFPLYRYFSSNKDYSLKYTMIANFTTKIVSREPFFIKEITQNCKAITPMDRTQKEAQNKLNMICNKNEFYEMNIDSATGKIIDLKLMITLAGQECLGSDWSKAANAYAVFCLEKGASSTADQQFYVVNIINPIDNKVVGTSKRKFADEKSYSFDERVKVRFRQVPKGGATATIVTIHDEPFADKDVSITAKSNDFFFLTEVDSLTKKPDADLQSIRFSSDTVLNKGEFYKGMTLEITDSTVFVAFYNRSQILKIASCKLDITTPKAAKIIECKFHTNSKDIGFGIISFLGNSIVAYFNKKLKEYHYCLLTPNTQDPTASVLTGCTKFDGRTGIDIDIRDFYSTGSKNLKVFYMTIDNRIDLGLDTFELSDVEPKIKLSDSFKAYCNASADLSGRYYAISESFLDVFDKTRAEELLIQGNLVPQDRGVPVTIEQDHQGAKDIRAIQVHQYPRFITAINPKSNFPSLIGFKGIYFKIPIGRDYFSGNAINFALKGDLAGKLIANAGEFEFKIDAEDSNNFRAYFHTNGYSVMTTKDNKVIIINCARKLENTFVLKCVKIGEKIGMNDKVGEKVLTTYHTKHLLVIVTTYGQFIFFNKVAHLSETMNLEGDNRFIKQVTFKPKDSLILISALVTDSKGVVAQISNFAFNEFARLNGEATDKYFYSVSQITKSSYQAESSQESGGDFCPKSIAYEIIDSPFLDILNACETKDRRILRFSMLDERSPKQLMNSYIRVNELKNDQIQMCPDLDTVIIASIGATQAIGIGYESSNIRQYLGLKELKVQKVTKLVCLGPKAFALGLLTTDDKFKIATYYTGKLQLANDRLHSLLEFSASDGYQDFTGSESEGYIYYNIFAPDKKTQFRMIYLDGPELFVKTNTRDQISDAAIDCSNGATNAYVPIPLSFKLQKSTVDVSSKEKGVKIEAKKYDIGNLCWINGPVFHYSIDQEVDVASISQRLTLPKEFISKQDAATYKSLYFSRMKVIRDITFILSQQPEKSQILMKFMEGTTRVLRNFTLTQTCHNFDIIEESDKTIGFVIALSCFYQNQKAVHFVTISYDGKMTYQGVTSIELSSKDLGLAFTNTLNQKSYRYMLANINENNEMTLYSFNFSTSADKINTKISFSSIVHTVSNGNL